MLKKIKMWLEKKQKEQAQKQQLIKAKKYYKLIQEGALFLKFIQNDLNEMKKKQLNRKMRRRFEKSLEDFKLNEETLQYYQIKVDSILNYIKGQLNPPKKPKVSGYQPKPNNKTGKIIPAKGGTGEIKKNG